MSDVFISYARSTAKQAQQVAEALRGAGYSVWIDDDLPAHRTYSRVIEEQMTVAKAAVVIWSTDAAQSEWVMSEANRAREDHKLVQVTTDKARLPMPFDTIQSADLGGWTGDTDAPGWRKAISSIADLVGRSVVPAAPEKAAPLPLPSKPSIAVLPFTNLSGDPEQEYFADGMVEEISNALSRHKSIFVIGSSSTLTLKGKGVGAQDAARQLGVRYVLGGSVRKAGNRVRIAVQLIDGADGVQTWSERFDDTLEDIFDLQDRVALSAAGRIGTTVQEAEVRRAAARPTENMGSYDLYLRGVLQMRAWTKSSVLESLDLLNRAIALDPNYGVALSSASVCHLMIHRWGWSDDPDGHRSAAIDMAHRALKVAGDDAAVLGAVAGVESALGRDADADAIALIDRALALNPGSSGVWANSGVIRLRIGETDLAVEHLETALRLDPIGPNRGVWVGLLGLARLAQRRYADAVASAKEYARQADSPIPHAILAASYGHLGERHEALEALTHYRGLTMVPAEDAARPFLRNPVHLKIFMDGIALAEGKSPTDAEGAR